MRVVCELTTRVVCELTMRMVCELTRRVVCELTTRICEAECREKEGKTLFRSAEGGSLA